ncbi:glycosyltransferase [Aureibaculum luteum]|uniref:glycosyltransferase n=1 Tax=Aureibaculum luteum TaxID=1548456 RepID=UPI000E493350|nr:glycosyltransferase [Aureibaculum luteum]
MTLNILISTIDEGIYKVKNVILEYREDVSYIVSHQFTSKEFRVIPPELNRSDITVSQIQGYGVTKSRNNAINLANGDIGLFSDDDVTYTNEYFNEIINTFSTNLQIDITLFKIKTPEGFPVYKNYPKDRLKIKKLPFSVGTIEIAFKINKIKDSKIKFDERFGAGQKLLIGSDENIFILDCIKSGLNVWFIPEFIVNHPFESTIKSLLKYDRRRVSVSGALDARINGISAIPRAIKESIRLTPDLIKNKKNPFTYMYERLSAAIFIIRTN